MMLLLKNLLFTLLVPGLVAVCVPLIIAQDRATAPAPLFVLGLLALAAGGSIYAWCVWDFASFGRGTPAPMDAPRKLVVRGLYRYTRNPMYLGVLTVLLGWALLYQAATLLLHALGVGISFHLMIVLYEEHHLERVFGDEYQSYRARVRRWLPRFRKRQVA